MASTLSCSYADRSATPGTHLTLVSVSGSCRSGFAIFIADKVVQGKDISGIPEDLKLLDSADGILEYVRKNKELFSYMLRRHDDPGGELQDFDLNLTQWETDMFLQ
ncbi:hypothetical protein BG006_001548 [Podila minutissima]|uniref:Uncharacterized protein n=1 Tax=Podila minutissima TaxID=64525 RepID=A0A9P5SA62_9FUNG|nr:hypothetical protein BG006_001548 [Podila minutissima]